VLNLNTGAEQLFFLTEGLIVYLDLSENLTVAKKDQNTFSKQQTNKIFAVSHFCCCN
jgi:hypothetical protein